MAVIDFTASTGLHDEASVQVIRNPSDDNFVILIDGEQPEIIVSDTQAWELYEKLQQHFDINEQTAPRRGGLILGATE